MIKSIFEDGYSWVEIPDELWARAEFSTVMFGRNVG
jgi:hypothetical protein